MTVEPSDGAWRRSGDIAARILENLAQRDAARLSAVRIGERRSPTLTTRGGAKYSGLAYQTFRNLLAAGEGPRRFKQGRLNVFYAVDLDE